MPTDIRESGLESLIVDHLVTQNGYENGESVDYNREYAVDELRLFRFLEATQPKQMQKLGVRDSDTGKEGVQADIPALSSDGGG